MDQKEINRLTAKVLHYLSFRDRSRQEIIDYLSKQQVTLELQEQVLQKIESLKLINDDSFADQLIRAKIKKGWGAKKIQFDLLNKGISKADANASLSQIPQADWVMAATNYLHKKSSTWINLSGIQRRQKIFQLLYTKGHTSKTIEAAIDALELPE